VWGERKTLGGLGCVIVFLAGKHSMRLEFFVSFFFKKKRKRIKIKPNRFEKPLGLRQ
jgi:hypothetical protein